MVALFAIVTGKWGWRSFRGMAKGAVAPRLPDLDRALRPKEYKIVIGIMILCQLAKELGDKKCRASCAKIECWLGSKRASIRLFQGDYFVNQSSKIPVI